MKREEKMLLLTVARLLRAVLLEDVNADIYVNRREDLAALAGALAPFDPAPGAPVNEAEGQ